MEDPFRVSFRNPFVTEYRYRGEEDRNEESHVGDLYKQTIFNLWRQQCALCKDDVKYAMSRFYKWIHKSSLRPGHLLTLDADKQKLINVSYDSTNIENENACFTFKTDANGKFSLSVSYKKMASGYFHATENRLLQVLENLHGIDPARSAEFSSTEVMKIAPRCGALSMRFFALFAALRPQRWNMLLRRLKMPEYTHSADWSEYRNSLFGTRTLAGDTDGENDVLVYVLTTAIITTPAFLSSVQLSFIQRVRQVYHYIPPRSEADQLIGHYFYNEVGRDEVEIDSRFLVHSLYDPRHYRGEVTFPDHSKSDILKQALETLHNPTLDPFSLILNGIVDPDWLATEVMRHILDSESPGQKGAAYEIMYNFEEMKPFIKNVLDSIWKTAGVFRIPHWKFVMRMGDFVTNGNPMNAYLDETDFTGPESPVTVNEANAEAFTIFLKTLRFAKTFKKKPEEITDFTDRLANWFPSISSMKS